MPTKQTRRSISVRGTTYDSLRRYCDSTQRSMSDIVEEQLAQLFSAKPVKTPKGARTVANKVVRAQPSAGRPAPTPAAEVIPERVRAPKGDYRVIRF